MVRPLTRSLFALCGAAALIAVFAAPASAHTTALLPSVSCSGNVHTSVSTAGATVTGTATCTGLTALSLTSTVNAAGVVSSLTSLLPALPNLPVPISTTIPAVGVSAACSVLTNVSTGATVATSCSS
jgi:hypothetical protein